METVVSGIRSTGNLHLGNYFGAMKNFIRMQRVTLKHRVFQQRIAWDGSAGGEEDEMPAKNLCPMFRKSPFDL